MHSSPGVPSGTGCPPSSSIVTRERDIGLPQGVRQRMIGWVVLGPQEQFLASLGKAECERAIVSTDGGVAFKKRDRPL